MKEYLETEHGQRLHRKSYIVSLLNLLLEREKEKARRRGRSELKQSKKEIRLGTRLNNHCYLSYLSLPFSNAVILSLLFSSCPILILSNLIFSSSYRQIWGRGV